MAFVQAELTHAGRDRGGLPLVMAIDNSGPGARAKLRASRREKQAIARFNAPHTPKHAEFAEGVIGEL